MRPGATAHKGISVSGVDLEVLRLKTRLQQTQLQMNDIRDARVRFSQEEDALIAERQGILDELLELGLTPEEVLWDIS